jgi:hypothetical protein
MGQMTDASLGISVSLPLNYENIDLIMKLIDINNLSLFISGLFEEDDEVINCDYDDTFDLDLLDELIEMKSLEEFKIKLTELDIKDDLIFNYLYIFGTIYARNLSFRSHSYLFHSEDSDTTPATLIQNIQKGVEIFKEAGVPEELIKIGNTISDG